jgi:hypothetical protein
LSDLLSEACSHGRHEEKKQVPELYCARQGWTYEVIANLGSGMDYHKKGLKKLLNAVIDDQVWRLIRTHKDRLLRFGAELVFAICEAKGDEIVILNQGGEEGAGSGRKTRVKPASKKQEQGTISMRDEAGMLSQLRLALK